MTRNQLIITQDFAQEYIVKTSPCPVLYVVKQPTPDLQIQAITPREKRWLGLLRKSHGAKLIVICQIWEMGLQAARWKPPIDPLEVHCKGIVAGAVGLLAKRRAGGKAKVSLYTDVDEISRYCHRIRSLFARSVLRRADIVIVETEEQREAIAGSFNISSERLLMVGDLLDGSAGVSCLYMHPERAAMLPYCKGKGIDVGCGSNKTHPTAIGVDIVSRGKMGSVGSQEGRVSQADICASGDCLDMFQDESLDYVVARHNIEHYEDPLRTLREWRRVLRQGGVVALVVPDDEALDTMRLDPSHKRAFTGQSFAHLVSEVGGLRVREMGVCIPGWSFKCIIEKV